MASSHPAAPKAGKFVIGRRNGCDFAVAFDLRDFATGSRAARRRAIARHWPHRADQFEHKAVGQVTVLRMANTLPPVTFSNCQ